MLHLAAKQTITSWRESQRFSTLVTGDQPILHLTGTEKHQGLSSEKGSPSM